MLSLQATTSKELEPLQKEAGRNNQTKEGERYLEQFVKAIAPAFGAALKQCGSRPDTKEPATIVFIIAADGRVKQLLYPQDIPFGECVGSKLRSIKTLPRPPRDSYVAAMGAANHEHEEKAKGPPDKPFKATREQLIAYDKAIAPYIARARATYPEAKKRFLAGLPPGYRFSVRTRLTDPNGQVEDSFLSVQKIENGKITGVLGAVELIHSYKEGQRITIPESKIDNWVIVRPDGTEEGNYVGKFLDNYKPQ